MLTQFLAACDAPDAHVHIVGDDVDLATSQELREFLRNLHRGGCTQLAVDATAVTFIDACSLAVLQQERDRLLDLGGTLEVVAASQPYLVAARLAGYDGLLPPDGRSARLRVVRT